MLGQDEHSGYYYVGSAEGAWTTGADEGAYEGGNLGYKPRVKEGYFPVPPHDTLQDIRSEIVLALMQAGIQVEVHHHEVASAGQNEIDMKFAPLTRIPMYSSSPASRRVEFRCPDPSANAYLAFAAMLMAGLDGIANKIEPGEPLDKNIYDLPPEEAQKVRQVPGSLQESLAALEEDQGFLTTGEVFTRDVIDTWIDYKRKKEIDPVRLRPHPWEFYLYFDI
jgi:glutamine synthetase